MKNFLFLSAFILFGFLFLPKVNASVIDFTGGTLYLNNGETFTTNKTQTYRNVDKYIESGFVLDFLEISTENQPNRDLTSIVGNYYNTTAYPTENDVIHGHWATGNFGDLLEIRIYRENDELFDLNYFEITSNTDEAGFPASGNEMAYITAFNSLDTQIGSSVLLPPNDWGLQDKNSGVYLGADFDAVNYVSITASNNIDCFGMDKFYFDEAAPIPNNPVPEPGGLLLMGTGIFFIAAGSKLRKKLK
jgi:hypothetical protein